MFLMIMIVAAQAALPPSLVDFHAKALQRSESLEMARSREEQAQERKLQARGTLFPQLNARYSYTEIDPLPGADSAFRRINQYSALVNLNQPIYRGNAISAYSFALLDVELQKRLKEQEGLNLWMQVGDAYFNLWRAQVDLANVRQLKQFSDERARELRERVRVGRSRRGELMQAEAQLATVDADLSRVGNTYQEALARVEFLAGEKLKPDFGALPDMILKTPELGVFLSAIHSRPDVKARSQEVVMAEKMVSIARAGHEPTVDFNANYFFIRTGILENSRWDLGVQVTMPIFQGGTVLAASREASERKREVSLGLERLKRELERDITILWQNASTVERVLNDLKNAVIKARATYEENKKDYRYGLVTSLDVLVSLNEYISTKRNYENALIDQQLIALQLQLSTGVTP
jgi:outer membrane protein TolC